jgi:ribonuclease P protein component
MLPAAREERYGRAHRFSARGSFGPLLRSGKKLRGDALVLHSARGQPGASRLGIALTRRLVRSSVHRNLVKRILRETFRRHGVKRAGFDCVVTLRERFKAGSEAALRAEALRLFDQLGGPQAQ